MAFDFKKECKELYKPASKPSIVTVPPMNYVAVRGKGDPNTEGGEYQNALPLLYGIAYTVKMSKKGQGASRAISTLWYRRSRVSGGKTPRAATSIMYARTISALSHASACPISSPEMTLTGQSRKPRPKKKLDFSAIELLKVDEGLCVQCMHTGPYDNEPATVDAMHEYTTELGYVPDFSDTRLHHEIYLSDPRKCAPEKLKTVVRHPIKRAE